jgi:hypothetical protein
MVRSDAADRVKVENTKAAKGWRLGRRRAQDLALQLDGKGVFEFFHARFQILDFALLFFEEECFNLA